MTKFAEECPIELLLGVRKPSIGEVKRSLAHRCVWVQSKVSRHLLLGERTECSPFNNPMIRELAALARAAELIEELEALKGCPNEQRMGPDTIRCALDEGHDPPCMKEK